MSNQLRYELPPKAYHPSDDRHPGADVREELWTVGRVEQRLRVDFALGGRANGIDFAEETVERQRKYEEENVFTDDPLEERLEHADPFLTQEFLSSRDNNEIEKFRWEWYDQMFDLLKSVHGRALDIVTDMSSTTSFRVHTIVDDDGVIGPYSSDHRSRYNGHDGHTNFKDHGFDLPVEVIVCESGSGNEYPFVPWYGTLICTCHHKIKNTRVPLCKHELAALMFAAEENLQIPDSLDPQFRRLASQEAYLNHQPEK